MTILSDGDEIDQLIEAVRQKEQERIAAEERALAAEQRALAAEQAAAAKAASEDGPATNPAAAPIVATGEVLTAPPHGGSGKPISEAKLAANRRNAQRSTGPRTAAGKARSRGNARKHGLRAQHIVLPGESAAEFKQLQQDTMQDLNPVGAVETDLVERMVECQWKLRRLRRYEQAEICRRLGSGQDHQQTYDMRVDPVSKALLEFHPFPRMDSAHDFEEVYSWSRHTEAPRQHLRQTVAGLGFLRELLQAVRAHLEQTGSADPEWEKKLFIYFGAAAGGVARTYQALRSAPANNRSEPRQSALAAIASELARLAAEQRSAQQSERRRQRAGQLVLTLPEPAELEQILRYEASLQRGYYRALAELERRQRRRQGEYVAPPLKAELTLEPGAGKRGPQSLRPPSRTRELAGE